MRGNVYPVNGVKLLANGGHGILDLAYNEAMRVRFERTGGFTGRKLKAQLDSAALPAAEASQLARLVAESRFFDLPGRSEAASPRADHFSYIVTIESKHRAHTIRASEPSVPPEIRPLLAWLSKHGDGPR